MKIICLVLAILLSGYAAADIDAYKCTVNSSGALKDNGDISPSDFSKMQVGKEFVVDKGTGRIKGGLSNDNAFGEPQVLDYGSSEQAFKVITIYKPMTTVKYLYIQEFNKSEKKPFMYIDGGYIYYGLCAPY